MKKITGILSVLAVLFMMSGVSFAGEVQSVEQSKAEATWETVSVMSQAAAEKTAESVKSGSKKAGKFIKEKSTEAAEKAAPHVKSGANKVKNATVRGANKVSNATAKGIKKAGAKMEQHADKTIERTNSELEKTAPCKCGCKENCKCKNQCDE